ncbi:MAG: IclR family transcriptional regulator [Syntrophorhabdaceae bacterium]|nr:IclR family transcriptional regulator [Syntrophorhabdaceae bacterium]
MYNAPILKKTFQILHFIVNNPGPLGVTEISSRLAISKSTVYGILKALTEEGLIIKDRKTKKYVIGPSLFELSKKVFKAGELIATVRFFLEKLVATVDETAFLCVKEGDMVRVLDTVEKKKPFKISFPVGVTFPITASATCKAFLSPLTDDEIKAFLKEKGLPKYTENSITDIETFLKEIQKTRENGYSIDFEEYLKGIRAVAALIYSEGIPAGAVCVVGFSTSMHDGKIPFIIDQIKETAKQITDRLSQLKYPFSFSIDSL